MANGGPSDSERRVDEIAQDLGITDEDNWDLMDELREAVDEDEKVNCPDCGGTGQRRVPIEDDWGEVEYTIEVKCSFCGGSGKFYADTAAELKAEGIWYDNPSYY